MAKPLWCWFRGIGPDCSGEIAWRDDRVKALCETHHDWNQHIEASKAARAHPAKGTRTPLGVVVIDATDPLPDEGPHSEGYKDHWADSAHDEREAWL